MIFLNKISSSLSEPELEPQFVISAPGGNLISAPRLSAPAPQHCFEGLDRILIPIKWKYDPHQKEKEDPDPHLSDMVPQHRVKVVQQSMRIWKGFFSGEKCDTLNHCFTHLGKSELFLLICSNASLHCFAFIFWIQGQKAPGSGSASKNLINPDPHQQFSISPPKPKPSRSIYAALSRSFSHFSWMERSS